VGSNPAEEMDFKADKYTSFGEEIKTSIPRHQILRHVKDPTGMKRDIS
jgi:hypothetical protein